MRWGVHQSRCALRLPCLSAALLVVCKTAASMCGARLYNEVHLRRTGPRISSWVTAALGATLLQVRPGSLPRSMVCTFQSFRCFPAVFNTISLLAMLEMAKHGSVRQCPASWVQIVVQIAKCI